MTIIIIKRKKKISIVCSLFPFPVTTYVRIYIHRYMYIKKKQRRNNESEKNENKKKHRLIPPQLLITLDQVVLLQYSQPVQPLLAPLLPLGHHPARRDGRDWRKRLVWAVRRRDARARRVRQVRRPLQDRGLGWWGALWRVVVAEGLAEWEC